MGGKKNVESGLGTGMRVGQLKALIGTWNLKEISVGQLTIEIIPPPLQILEIHMHTHTYPHMYIPLLVLLIKKIFLGLTCIISFTRIQSL